MTGRPVTGQVIKPDKGRRSFALRFTAYGKREFLTLGRPEDGWTTVMAERELAVVLRDIERGVWQPPAPEPEPGRDPRFHEFASQWFEAKQRELAPNTARSYRNDLTNHLLPFFSEHKLSQITISEVDAYRQQKVHEATILAAAIKAGEPGSSRSLTVAAVATAARRARSRTARSTCTWTCSHRSSSSPSTTN